VPVAIASTRCIARADHGRTIDRVSCWQLKRLMIHADGSGVRGFPAADSSLLAWRCAVLGPEGTPWAGRSVELLLRFCGPWPFAPPLLFALEPRPWHPNVDDTTGAVCMDLLQEQWSPAGGVLSVLLSLRSLLASPTLDDATSMPANVEAASQWQREPARFKSENERRAAGMQPWGAAGGDQFAHM
jgi:ubiquitin-conjugating enzyme E2 C